MNPSTAQSRVVVDELIRGGVREVVLCPGSRNAPLAFALSDADRAGRLRLHVRIDERTAGFLAVGLGLNPREVPSPLIDKPAPAFRVPQLQAADQTIAPEDMKGKVFGFGDPNSTSGYLIPSVEIPMATGASMENGDYFGEVRFTGGHEQTIVAVANGDVDAGVTWADGIGNWEDGFNSGALRKAADAGLVNMTDLVEIWRSKVIPEGPIVLRKALPEDTKLKMTGLMASLASMDKECAYGVMAGEVKGIAPIDHSEYVSIIEARKASAK